VPPAALGSKRRLDDSIAPEAKRPAPSSQPPRETIFRLLSSSRKIGAVIGRGGEIVKQLKAETGARIKVADAVPNCDERVVIMSSSPDPDVQWNCAQVDFTHASCRVYCCLTTFMLFNCNNKHVLSRPCLPQQ